MMNAFSFAVVPTCGMYGNADAVRVEEFSETLEAAQKRAARLTKQYRGRMARFGGSSGGYRVIAWGHDGRTISGRMLDRTPDAR
jgi:hypothetical protein